MIHFWYEQKNPLTSCRVWFESGSAVVGSENDDKMGPKKKNKRHNDFYYFMMDNQKEIETELGKKISDLQQLEQLCSPRWSELDDHAKKKYVFHMPS